ncbi:mirror-image polydactyly gene 1 protein [Pelobates fuscus]|uniref:mirror-image polydactyly gene 1 protein n=1 Tax=Pelobates fuscus TaxID=191477 RepID=UPI002FE45BA3
MSQELINPTELALKKMPIPSPRHISAPKTIEKVDQSDGHPAIQKSDRQDLPCKSDHWTSCSLERGEQSPAALAEELDYLRQTNKKLLQELMSRDRELETLRLDAELQEQASQARIAEKTAALVEEVYHAQRERDEAVMARLRLANEERDEALLRVQHLQMFLKELEDINPEEGDTTIQELVGRLVEAEGGIDIQQNGELILERIRQSRERRELITAEEMGVVIQERDSARAQVTHLEKELHQLRESKLVSMDDEAAQITFEAASKASLNFLQDDQEEVIERYKKLEEELQTLRVYYSLHQSLSQEVNLKEQYSRAVTLYDEALRNREELLNINQRQNQELAHQLQQAQNQCTELQESLQRATAYQQETQEKVYKLERLVDVLRKKVGIGNVRTVI